MRRKEKEITDRAEMEAILRRGEICRLAMANDNTPYVVALNYGYADNCLGIIQAFTVHYLRYLFIGSWPE